MIEPAYLFAMVVGCTLLAGVVTTLDYLAERKRAALRIGPDGTT